jgi:hypothetical protein
MKTLQQRNRQITTRRVVLANPKQGEANRALVQRALGHPLQASLTMGSPGDVHEREADAIAERVVSMPQAALQRKCCAGCDDDNEVRRAPLHVQRLPDGDARHDGRAPDSVAQVLRGAGRPLEPVVRRDMEARFAHDFSHVRVHSDAAGERSAAEVGARAYTVGEHVVFGAGQYAPASGEGRRLLAHELTHVLQQRPADASVVAAGESDEQDSTLSPLARDGEQTLRRADCPCCVESVGISNVNRIDSTTQMGHSFDVTIALSYPQSGPSGSAVLEWWERTNVPAIPGHQPNTWTDMYALYSVSPTFDPWRNRAEACGTSSPVVITDPPSLAKRPGRTVNRTLEFRIVANSQPANSDSGCAQASQQVTARQVLSMVNGAADWSASSFTTP